MLISSLNASVDDTALEYPGSATPFTQQGAGMVQRAEKQSKFPGFSVQIKGSGLTLVLEAAFSLNVVKNLL